MICDIRSCSVYDKFWRTEGIFLSHNPFAKAIFGILEFCILLRHDSQICVQFVSKTEPCNSSIRSVECSRSL